MSWPSIIGFGFLFGLGAKLADVLMTTAIAHANNWMARRMRRRAIAKDAATTSRLVFHPPAPGEN